MADRTRRIGQTVGMVDGQFKGAGDSRELRPW
jgi:hypothetical protein